MGQYVLAIGNPFGQDHTLTTGVISGRNRQINAPTGRKINGIIQTDAAINPGNSGGPLLDSQGRLIGVNTASLGSGVSAGVGFALPIDIVKSVVDQIIQFGAVQRATLGISYLERLPTPAEAERGGLPRIEQGVVVLEVSKDGPALAGGMQGVTQPSDPKAKAVLGDVIVAIDDNSIANAQDLSTVMEKYKPGDKVQVKVLRGPQQKPMTLKIAMGFFKGSSYTGIEADKPQQLTSNARAGAGVQFNIPLGQIAPQITPRMPSPDNPLLAAP